MDLLMGRHASVIDLDPYSPVALKLLEASDAYLGALYPPESNHLSNPDDLDQPHVRFMGYEEGLKIVGCGAVKTLEDSTGQYGEIKRVFVLMEFRGRGISKALMNARLSGAHSGNSPSAQHFSMHCHKNPIAPETKARTESILRR
ncbi:MAG: hypothetical protein RLZ25_206 [Pseudomonadota bacterium]